MRLKFTLLIALFAVVSLSAQEIEVKTEQSTLLVKKTATWCPFCGQWGWTMMKGIMDDNQDKAVILGAHYSGNLRNATAEAMMSHYGGSGQPVFFENKTNLRVNSGNTTAKIGEVKAIVDANYATTARIGVGVLVEDNNGVYDIDVRTEFQEEVTGDFNISLWIIEDDVLEVQSGRSGMQEHPNVIRESVNGTFGEVLASGTTPAGTVNDFSFQYTPNSSYKLENLKFVAIIWADNAGTYSFENGLVQDEVEISTSSTDLETPNTLSVSPSILTDYTSVETYLNQGSQVSIRVIDLLGNEVINLYNGTLAAGSHRFNIGRGDIAQAGMYLISMNSGGERITKRLLVK